MQAAHARGASFIALSGTAEPQLHCCQVLLRWVEEYGPNIALRLAWVNVLVITEVRTAPIPTDRASQRPSVAGCAVSQDAVRAQLEEKVLFDISLRCRRHQWQDAISSVCS